ncbi:mll4709 [Mesorhizobium japonicum MAFF 303099]|uniref:Mll4709 protein n=2 Tax=Mesorhizobium japonicum TaxID=2066070 RepID=Q98DG9_RHILO|nr:mll4709 [Mesorhizobium japonicum MAFF 303099]
MSTPGDLVMTDNKPTVDVTKDWQASQGQKSGATRLRLFAVLSWVVAIGGEIAGIVLLYRHKFDQGNLPLLIGILIGIAIFAIAGSLLWKAANRQDPARESEPFRFFVQNQLGAIITLIAFLPLVLLILNDKNMDPKSKKIAGGVGAVLAVLATLIGVSYQPPSVEQYTQDMNACASQIKSGQPTTACSPEVAAQAQAIATDSTTVAAATKDSAHPNGQDIVYWIAPENGAAKSGTEHVFHLCAAVSPLKDKTVNSGTVTEAYAQNAIRITKQIEMEQKQCGFSGSQ